MKTEFVFLASGLMFERVKGNDFTAIEYKNILNVERQEDTENFNICVLDGDSDTDPYVIQCTNAQERIDLMKELRKRKEEWLEREAVQREEEREFRASLLAHLGKLTERIAFDPDFGDEALDAIERCKKRARGEEDE